MQALFKHPDGRLKITRITLAVFLVMLGCFSMLYHLSRSADKVFVAVEHVFEPVKKRLAEKTPQPEPQKAEQNTPSGPAAAVPEPEPAEPQVEPVPEKAAPPVVKAEKKKEKPQKKPVETLAGDQAPPEPQKASPVPVKPEAKPVAAVTKAEQTPEPAAPKPEKPAEQEKPDPEESRPAPMALAGQNETALPELPVQKKTPAAEREPLPDLRTDLKTVSTPQESAPKSSAPVFGKLPGYSPEPPTEKGVGQLTLAPDSYFDTYQQWQAQGKALKTQAKRLGLRIVNLENTYDLFQMKVVALKNDVPHTDLTDQSRVAQASLSEFSSTCFIVSDPWEKWGKALKGSGFNDRDKVEIRYYTYAFVRDAIYARAMQAFAWSRDKKGLPEATDPSTADVLGKVFAIQRQGGGRFGVFIPVRVDFSSGASVEIDPLACFGAQKDVLALNRAGLL